MEEAASEAAEHNLQIVTVWSSVTWAIWGHGDTMLIVDPSSRLFRGDAQSGFIVTKIADNTQKCNN